MSSPDIARDNVDDSVAAMPAPIGVIGTPVEDVPDDGAEAEVTDLQRRGRRRGAQHDPGHAVNDATELREHGGNGPRFVRRQNLGGHKPLRGIRRVSCAIARWINRPQSGAYK